MTCSTSWATAAPTCEQHVFPLPFAFSSVRSPAWRSWMTLRSWRRRGPRLEKPTGCSRTATAAGRGRTYQRNTHRKSQILSEEHRISYIYEPFPSTLPFYVTLVCFLCLFGYWCLLVPVWCEDKLWCGPLDTGVSEHQVSSCCTAAVRSKCRLMCKGSTALWLNFSF